MLSYKYSKTDGADGQEMAILYDFCSNIFHFDKYLTS
jgi:hypothetical protein